MGLFNRPTYKRKTHLPYARRWTGETITNYAFAGVGIICRHGIIREQNENKKTRLICWHGTHISLEETTLENRCRRAVLSTVPLSEKEARFGGENLSNIESWVEGQDTKPNPGRCQRGADQTRTIITRDTIPQLSSYVCISSIRKKLSFQLYVL